MIGFFLGKKKNEKKLIILCCISFLLFLMRGNKYVFERKFRYLEANESIWKAYEINSGYKQSY